MFVGIEFENDEGVAVVCNRWLTPRKKHVQWPPYKQQHKYNLALQKQEKTGANWKTCAVKRLFFETDDLIKAQSKIKRAQFTSDFQSDTQLENDDNCFKTKNKRIRTLPSRYDDYQEVSSDDEAISKFQRPPIIQISPSCSKSGFKPSQINDFVPLPSTSAISESENTDRSVCNPPLNITFEQEPRLDGIQAEAFQGKLIRCLSKIIDQNKEILSILRSNSNNSGNNKPDLPVPIPLKTLEELEELERHLAEKTNQQSLCYYLASLDRTNVSSATSSALRCCLSYGLGKDISFLGTRNNKKAFNNYILKKVIVDAVKIAVPQATARNIEDQIKNWLKRSPKNYFAAQEKLNRENENSDKTSNVSNLLVPSRSAVQLSNAKSNNVETHFIDDTVDDTVETDTRDDSFKIKEFLASLETNEIVYNLDVIGNLVCGSEHVAENNASPTSNTSKNNVTLCDKLRHWTITSKPTHNSITKLLHILSPLHPDLPLDSRTLLGTPTKIKVEILDTGKYCHLGFITVLEHFLINNPTFSSNILEICFNIDGLPLFKSCNGQIWPILGQVKNCPTHPFPIGIFYGNSKPKPLELFLNDFVLEVQNAILEGFNYNKKQYFVKIFGFVCDAPARAFLKRVKNHGGYAACEKCTVYGDFNNGRVIYDSTSAPKRTDETFAKQVDEDHHLGISPLVHLPFGMVSQFPLDYMHNVCLGVVKKLLNHWIAGPLNVRLSKELPRWKATELRTFLLYVGPIILKKYIDLAIYEHFMLLHCAINILISETALVKLGVDFAETLLNTFVNHSSFYAFPYENFLNKIKNLVKSTNHPLTEIHNRLIESYNVLSTEERNSDKWDLKFPHNLGPLINSIHVCRQYKKVILRNFTLSTHSYSVANCYCLIGKSTSQYIVQIQNIVYLNSNSVIIIGKKFNFQTFFYTYPIKSSELNIYLISDLSTNLNNWPLQEVIAKCIVFPLNDAESVSFTHYLNNE
ncbi:unnamed protein product [Brassicogethes aeneus]|uniref:DUF4806 domain-containing protein n=1 Tax=Brassicogethes aeneus TaxID=1431903 RepID=A0A9P0FLS3_BRAAE|nr:unnamed protein product [Brassicogethes aeneus]